MKNLAYIFLLFAGLNQASAQTVTGSWYGHADVAVPGLHNNYLTELVIKQKGTRVEGIFGYYFRDKYQSYFIHGRYDPATHQITILDIPMIFYGSVSTENSVDCITNFRGTVIRNKMGSSVRGTFYHDEKYKYTCPDIKVNYELDKSDNHTDSVIDAGPAVAKIWKPKDEDYVVDVTRPAGISTAIAPVDSPVSATSGVSALVAPDSVTTALTVTPSAAAEDAKKIEESFNARKATGHHVYEVESDSIRLSFYDNGEIDGDSISVFVNNNLILSHQGLAAKAFNLYLRLDSTRDVNEISMFAENLGRIPPNTALMVLTDGKNRYEVFMSSSLTENATIEVKRKKP
ncbi:MAG TPA: hypothetical protein VGS79_25990 [Puia sp.]|nr:hypothetical protein [Puia sp.]